MASQALICDAAVDACNAMLDRSARNAMDTQGTGAGKEGALDKLFLCLLDRVKWCQQRCSYSLVGGCWGLLALMTLGC